MPLQLTGSSVQTTVAGLRLRLADELGYTVGNNRFSAMALRWIQAVVKDIQNSHPKLRRAIVHDADFTLIAGQEVYDVRATANDGGFGWTECQQVLSLVFPSISSRPLEPLSLDQWRDRSYLPADQGPSIGWVCLDQFRVRIVPAPDQAYIGKGDYLADFPSPTDGDHAVDWPRMWDEVLYEGCLFHGMRWQHQQQPSVWIPQHRIYQEKLSQLWQGDQSNAVRPRRAIQTRALRSRRAVIRDRSTDSRHRW